MLIADLEQVVDSFAVRVVQNYGGWLPFNGKYLLAFRSFLVANTGRLKTAWEDFHASGDAERLVDFIIDLARGNLAVGFPFSILANVFLEGLRKWLKANQNLVRDSVGVVV